MTRRRYLVFGLISAALATSVMVVALVVVDVALHARYQRWAGYNVWGYRGPVAGPKRAGERRVVVIGGSTAFGYGVAWDQAFPAVLERKLQAARGAPVSVVNLGWNNEGAHAFLPTLRDYRYLEYDVALLYEGYNDLGGPGSNRRLFRRDSAIFRLTGYLPIFPLVAREKALALLHGGDLDAAFRPRNDGRVVFTPRVADRLQAFTLTMAADVSAALERQIGHLSRAEMDKAPIDGEAPTGCHGFWREYCGSVTAAVGELVAHGRSAVVVTQPYISDGHLDQQRALRGLLAARFGADPRVRYVNLGPAVDLRDPALVLDGMHLSASGNDRIAGALVPHLLQVLGAR